MLLSACMNQETGWAENHPAVKCSPTSDHRLGADLGKMPWFGQFVAIQRPLPHCGDGSWTWTCLSSVAIPDVWDWERNSLGGDDLCTGCSRNVFSSAGINLREMLDYISHQQIWVWRNTIFQQSEVLFGYKPKINSCGTYWISIKYFEFVKCDLGCFQESLNLKRKWRFLTAYLPVLANYTL